MTAWSDLVVAATVGTASRRVDLAATPSEILAAAPPGADAAGSLLDAAVAFTIAQRAGRPPVRGEIPPPPPTDPRPVVSPVAAGLAASVLVDRELDLAGLALGAVARSGRRLPDALAPAVLALAARHTALRADALAACGPVAPWLAARNPAWSWAAGRTSPTPPVFDAGVWETGSRSERVAQLRALHATDPDAAAALLTAGWPATAADEREDLLAALGPVPPAGAEPVLETALTDRRAGVRALAAAGLARLPGSAFRARAAARVTGLLRPERRGLRRVLAVAAPGPFDPAARRDGLQEAAGAPQRLGPTAGPVAARVRQLVAAAPVDTWEGMTGLPPEQLVRAAIDPYADEVLAGWVDAACRDRDPRWVAALLDAAAHREPLRARRAELVAALAPARRPRAVVDALTAARPEEVAAVLAAASTPWDPPLVEAFGAWWRRAVRAVPGRELLAVLPLAARGLPATAGSAHDLRDAAEHARDGAVWPRAARAAADTLDLRRRLHEELR